MIDESSVSQSNLQEAAESLWNLLIPHITYLSDADKELVQLAFWQMVEAHGEQRRKSGEFYIIHPVAACINLTRLKLDASTLAAGLLHDVPEDTHVTLDEITQNFGTEIAFLVSGITKLGKVKYQGEERYAENLRRMFVAMSKDVRVIYIKLADRLHNLQTLDHVRVDKQRRIALESLEIYAAIAERLGIGFFKGEIEDLAFKYILPQEYEDLQSSSHLKIEERTRIGDDIINSVTSILSHKNIHNIKVYGRAKRYYSIYRKLKDKDISITNMYDLFAIRIITRSVDQCYEVLSELQQEFEFLDYRLKDYIAVPKANGYQSIHAVMIDPKSGMDFEIQIRTEEMHEFAEYGVAAHFSYKQHMRGEKRLDFVTGDNLKWLQEIVELGNDTIDKDEYIRRVKLDLFNDRIFVLTPLGDVIELPMDATPIDFAFHIHNDVGIHASMALVNGHPHKLSQPLRSGDVVEIITDKKQQPKPDWLNWVVSRQARHGIKSALSRNKH